MNAATYLATATIDRNEWLTQRDATIASIARQLAEITQSDERYQRQVRGLGPTDAKREAINGLKGIIAELPRLATEQARS